MYSKFISRPHFQSWYKIIEISPRHIKINQGYYLFLQTWQPMKPHLGVFKLLQFFCGWGNACIYMTSLSAACSLRTQAGQRALQGNIWNSPLQSHQVTEIWSTTPWLGFFKSLQFFMWERTFAFMRSIRCLLFSHKQDNWPFGVTFEIPPLVT